MSIHVLRGLSNLAKIAFALPEKMNILIDINYHQSRRNNYNFGLSISTHLHFNFIYFGVFFGGGFSM